jgi:hypothetical protein
MTKTHVIEMEADDCLPNSKITTMIWAFTYQICDFALQQLGIMPIVGLESPLLHQSRNATQLKPPTIPQMIPAYIQ